MSLPITPHAGEELAGQRVGAIPHAKSGIARSDAALTRNAGARRVHVEAYVPCSLNPDVAKERQGRRVGPCTGKSEISRGTRASIGRS